MTEATKKPRKRKPSGPFSDELLDQLLAQVSGKDAESLLGESGLIGQLKKQLAERMLAAELTHHLANEEPEEGAGNHRNGSSPKTVLTPNGALDLSIPRDRLSTFEPQLVAKHQRRLPGFDEHVIGMYARGMTVREIQGHLVELYGLEISPDLISTITDEVMAEVADWQARPLDAMYPIIYFDALRLKIRDEGTVRNKAVYLALGIDATGRKDVLGLWIEQTEGAKFWLKVFNDIKQRGVVDILIAVVDGLRGFPCCPRFPCVHAVATTPAQQLVVLLAHPSSCINLPRKCRRVGLCIALSRLAQRSLTLRPAHSRCHHFVTRFTRRLQPFRCLHSYSGHFRLELIGRVGFAPTGKAPPYHGAHTLPSLVTVSHPANNLARLISPRPISSK